MQTDRKSPQPSATLRQRAASAPETPTDRITLRRTRKLVAYRARASASDVERYQRWLGVF